MAPRPRPLVLATTGKLRLVLVPVNLSEIGDLW